MAYKQGKLLQRNKHPKSVSRILAPSSQEHSSDPWSFLELIDAPQWVDLSMEASLMGKEGFDSWFDRSHKHHVISLASLNTNMSWLRLGKSSQGKGPISRKGCLKGMNKSEKKQSAGHLHKLGDGQSQSQSQVKGLQVHQGAQYSNSRERGCNPHRLYGSVETGCTSSGCSSTSECEPRGSFKKRSLCSDRSSVSSSLQDCSVELKKFSSNGHGGSKSEDIYDTPTSSTGGGAQRNRNSSSASYCPLMTTSRYSYEVRVSTCTKSSELGVSTCTKSSEPGVSTSTKSQFVREADPQSSGDSVVTSVSGASHTSERQVGKGCARIWEEGADGTRKIGEQKDDIDGNQPLKGFIADSSTLNKISIHCQQMANDGVKSGIKAGRQRLDTRVSQVGLLPRKQLYTGKENAPPKESLTAANLLQVKDKPLYTKAPLAFASSKTANTRTVGSSLGGGFRASQVKKKEGPQCASQVVPFKSGISQNLNIGRASSVAHQRKRSEAKQLPVTSNETTKSERDLAALVAQHNQKIRSLGLQNCRKGLR